jgi:hypothetical protein
MKAHFEAPFDGLGPTDVFVKPFAAVFLSHSAVGFMNVALSDDTRRKEVSTVLDEVARRVQLADVSPYKKSIVKVKALGDHNLYLSHLNLVIGARRLISGDPSHDGLHRRVSRHLVQKSVSDKTAHARSYPRSARFPADQAALLASLHLYDLAHGTTLSKRPVARWLDHMKRARHKKYGLHRSSLSPSFKAAHLPRGCALSWTVLYMAQFAPAEARALYSRYRSQFYTHIAGWGGFREYPHGVDGSMDVDSGPIIFGMGVAATGIGLGSARLFGDRRAYSSIMGSAASVGLPPLSFSSRKYLLAPLLGEAILFHGITARQWAGGDTRPGAPPPVVGDEGPPFPTGPLIVTLLIVALLARGLRRLHTTVVLLRETL